MVRITVRMARNNKLAGTDDWGVGNHYLSVAGYHLDMYYRGDLASRNLERQLEDILLRASDRKVIHNRAFYGHRMICIFWGTATDANRLGLVRELESCIGKAQKVDDTVRELNIDNAFFAAFERGDYDK